MKPLILTLTTAEQAEWDYVYAERLSLMGVAAGDKATAAQEEVASREAYHAVLRMRGIEEKPRQAEWKW